MYVGALYTSDPSSVDAPDTNLHGQNFKNQEYVKYDLSGKDLGESDFSGSFFSPALCDTLAKDGGLLPKDRKA